MALIGQPVARGRFGRPRRVRGPSPLESLWMARDLKRLKLPSFPAPGEPGAFFFFAIRKSLELVALRAREESRGIFSGLRHREGATRPRRSPNRGRSVTARLAPSKSWFRRRRVSGFFWRLPRSLRSLAMTQIEGIVYYREGGSPVAPPPNSVTDSLEPALLARREAFTDSARNRERPSSRRHLRRSGPPRGRRDARRPRGAGRTAGGAIFRSGD